MSGKTIEIVSRHTGQVALCTKKGEQRTVTFEPKAGGVGFALCDEDEAEILLGCIGKPDYWKTGQNEEAQSGPVEINPGAQTGESENTNGEGGAENTGGEGDDASANSDQVKVLTKEGYDAIKNAKDLQALLENCEDVALIMELVAVEAQKEPTRSTWMKALNDRLTAIQK